MIKICFCIIYTDKFSNLHFKVQLCDVYFKNYFQVIVKRLFHSQESQNYKGTSECKGIFKQRKLSSLKYSKSDIKKSAFKQRIKVALLRLSAVDGIGTLINNMHFEARSFFVFSDCQRLMTTGICFEFFILIYIIVNS